LRRNSISEEQKQLEEESLPLFNKVSNKKNYVVAIVAFMVAALTILMAVFSLPLVVVSP